MAKLEVRLKGNFNEILLASVSANVSNILTSPLALTDVLSVCLSDIVTLVKIESA